MRHVLVHLDGAAHVVVDKPRHLRARLEAAKGTLWRQPTLEHVQIEDAVSVTEEQHVDVFKRLDIFSHLNTYNNKETV